MSLPWLHADVDTFLQIASGLDRLETTMREGRVSARARERGYFTPDEDDYVRQMMLAYRNYRLSTHEIIERCREYEQAAEADDRLRLFIVGYAAALTLYFKSLQFIRSWQDDSLVRAKLNEPEPTLGLEADFFDTVVASYASLDHYLQMAHAARFWSAHRREVRRRAIDREEPWGPLCERIVGLRPAVRREFRQAVGERLAYRIRNIRDLPVRPLEDVRYGIQALAGGVFGHLRKPAPPPCFDDATFAALRPHLRPGDVLVMRTERKLTTALLPGFWIHAGVYVGDGKVAHAINPRVTVEPLEVCLRVDHVAVLRPRLSDGERLECLRVSRSHVGKPYDFDFDFTQTVRLVCTSLVYRAFHGRGDAEFSLVKRMGRYTLTCDELCEQALRPRAEPAFDLAALVVQARDGRAHLTTGATAMAHLRAIQAGMRPSRDLDL